MNTNQWVALRTELESLGAQLAGVDAALNKIRAEMAEMKGVRDGEQKTGSLEFPRWFSGDSECRFAGGGCSG